MFRTARGNGSCCGGRVHGEEDDCQVDYFQRAGHGKSLLDMDQDHARKRAAREDDRMEAKFGPNTAPLLDARPPGWYLCSESAAAIAPTKTQSDGPAAADGVWAKSVELFAQHVGAV